MPAARNQKIRPLQGGIQIEGRPGPGRIATGTLGLVFDKESGGAQQARFVTAGHVVGSNDAVGQPGIDDTVGKVEINLLPDADLAIVTVNVNIPADVGRVWTGDNSYITVKFASSDLPVKNSTVVLQGSVSGNVTGKVMEPNADITDATTKEKARNVVVVEYGAATAPGDSGAPVLSALEDGALCYGVHGGSARVYGKIVGWFTPFANIEW